MLSASSFFIYLSPLYRNGEYNSVRDFVLKNVKKYENALMYTNLFASIQKEYKMFAFMFSCTQKRVQAVI